MNLIISSICIALTLGTMLASAQQMPDKKRLEEINKVFDALPEEERGKYLELKRKAYEDFKLKKYLTCMVAVSDARKIFRDDFDLIYFLATCRAQIRDYNTATEYYNQVLEINPQHIPSLISIIDINLYEGRYEETIKKINQLNVLIRSRSAASSSLLDFKYLLCITKLSSENPGKYDEDLKKMQGLYTYMDDDLYFYYAQALKEIAAGKKEEGLSWIMKAYMVFRTPNLMEGWNQVLTEAGYLDFHELIVNKAGEKK